MAAPDHALEELASLLREERSVISPHVAASADAPPSLGRLAASGVRAGSAPGEYALVVEAVREGYLLHYGDGRVVLGADPDLALLAGDYLYALGLERLAAIGDLTAVRELSDLISLAAQVHDQSRAPDRVADEAAALWLATATAIAAGPTPVHDRAKAELRDGSPAAARSLRAAARGAATAGGFDERLDDAADAIDCGRTPLF